MARAVGDKISVAKGTEFRGDWARCKAGTALLKIVEAESIKYVRLPLLRKCMLAPPSGQMR